MLSATHERSTLGVLGLLSREVRWSEMPVGASSLGGSHPVEGMYPTRSGRVLWRKLVGTMRWT